ncbi:hypothetical protein PIB30_029180 [Stylosanthes scabra]|uniref:Uncharacterized protein n=1 Tax=Stylosanthes scabra TaxID=79078 RepID=A0ABU6Z817_9FABA|nr:hypothetical protein [Stylosanthes scabra]
MKKNNFKIKEETAMCSPTTDLLFPPQQMHQGSVSTAEWTNEKHSMYLNSMEASFVHQLYDLKQTFASITRLNESHHSKTNPWIHQHHGSSHKQGTPKAPIVHAEMSDQNFADEEGEVQKENNTRDGKRRKRSLMNEDAAPAMRT